MPPAMCAKRTTACIRASRRGVVELQAGDALSRRRDRRFCEFSQLAAIDEGLHNVLLYVQVVVVDRRQRIAQRGEVLHRLVDAIVVDVVARRLGAQNEVIANVLPTRKAPLSYSRPH